jgi:lysophospholipase L1-like esterase
MPTECDIICGRMDSLKRFALGLCAVALLSACGKTQTATARTFLLEYALAAEVDRFIAADRAAPPPPCQVLFVGSSSIVKWRENLAADMAPVPVINRGFGGSHIEYVNRWFDKLVAPYRPRAIVFYAGDNDIDAGKSVTRVVADFDTFMALKRQSLGPTPVYFISVKPSRARFAQLALQTQVNDAIRAREGERSDLHYIDVVSPMLDNGKLRDIYVADGLHMNRDGYAIWARVVKATLLPDTEAEESACRAANKL